MIYIDYFIEYKKQLIHDLHKYEGVISFTSDLWKNNNKTGNILGTAH